jgi:hypothetical protein
MVMTAKELRFFIQDALKDQPDVHFWFHENDPYDGWSYGVQAKRMPFCSLTYQYNHYLLEVTCGEEDQEEFQRLCDSVQRVILSRRKSSVYLAANRLREDELRPLVQFAHASMRKKRGQREQQ